MGANNFVDATEVVIATDGGTYTETGVNNSTFTLEAGEPSPTTWDSGRSAWWKYTPASGGTVSVDTNLTTGFQDTEIAVYTGSAVNALTKIASDSDSGTGNLSSLSFTATAGTTYHIQVNTYQSNTSSYGLSVTGPASTTQLPPSGALASVLPVPSVALAGSAPLGGSFGVALPLTIAALSGAAPTPGALSATLPLPTMTLAGGSPIPGALSATLPVLTLAGTGTTPPPRSGYGLALDSTATVAADAPLEVFPVGPIPDPVTHVIVPTVPAPVLVDGRPS